MQRFICLSTALFATSFLAISTGAVSLNQVDDFQDGTVEGWAGNKYGTNTNVADGGPQGNGDGYLRTAISGFHLGTLNTNQWTGNYLASGVGAIEMDLKRWDDSADEVRVRILIFGPGGTYASVVRTPPVTTDGWSHHVFGLGGKDLVHVTGSFKVPDGTGILEDTLEAVTYVLIRNDYPTPTIPGFHPPHITASLGIDNIRAVIRRPVITGLQVTGTTASVDIGALVAGTSNVVEQTRSWVNPAWTNLLGFTASGTTTNVAMPATADTGQFRVRLP